MQSHLAHSIFAFEIDQKDLRNYAKKWLSLEKKPETPILFY